VVQPSLPSALVAVCLLPLAAGGLIYFRAWRAHTAERSAALAQLDHRFGIKDRIQTADEFERVARRSSFQAAALEEASPWLDLAAAASVPSEPVLRLRWSRLWLWPVLALMLVTLAFCMSRIGSAVGLVAPVAEAGEGAMPAAAGAAPSDGASSLEMLEAAHSQAAAARSDGAPGPDGDGAIVSKALARLAALLNPDRSSAGGSRDAGRSGVAGEAAAGGGKSAGRGAQGAAGRGGSRGAGAGEPQIDRSSSDDQTSAGEAGAEDQSDVASAPASNSQASGGRQDAPSARQAEPPRSGSNSSQGERQEPGGRSRRGDQGQQGGEQSGGQGESGRQSGADAGAKKGRGVSSLLLATPMQDRLAGMASPGRTSTTTRDGAPQAFPVSPGQAGDRGMARNEAARSAPRTTSPQDQRLTRDYFTQRNAGGR
jgi:hypothetical protein